MGSGRCGEVGRIGERVDSHLTEMHQERMLDATGSAGRRHDGVSVRRMRPTLGRLPAAAGKARFWVTGASAVGVLAGGDGGDADHVR